MKDKRTHTHTHAQSSTKQAGTLREILPRMHSNVPNYAKREKVVRETGFSFDSFAKSKVLKTRDETSSGRVELYEKPFSGCQDTGVFLL